MRIKGFLGRTKVTLMLIIFLPLAFIILGINQVYTYITDQELTAYKQKFYEDEANKLSSLISSNIEELLTGKTQFYDDIAQKYSIEFEVFNHEDHQTLFKTYDHENDVQDLSVIDVPILLDGKMLGYLKTYYDTTNDQLSPAIVSFEKNLHHKKNIIMVSFFIIALFLSLMVAHFVAKPVEKASDAAVQLTRGERGINVPRKGTLEIKNLIDSLNNILVEFENMENWRQQMLQDMTHELRTPVTSILTTLEAMIDGVYPKSEEYLLEIYGEVDRLSRLIINVQNLSEAEGARFALDIQATNLVEIIKSTIEGFQFIAKKKDIKIDFNYQKRPHIVFIDPDRFIQVITNVLSNALKYTPSFGTVEVGLDRGEDEFLFYCIDTGVGLSEEEQLLVFNRFYRVSDSATNETGGSGIGLNISKALVQAHGGQMGVESVKEEGSLFWVKMPINHDKSLNEKQEE